MTYGDNYAEYAEYYISSKLYTRLLHDKSIKNPPYDSSIITQLIIVFVMLINLLFIKGGISQADVEE